jgi:hypothetical protein
MPWLVMILKALMKGRAALAKKRLSWAQTISTTGDIPDKAVEGPHPGSTGDRCR